MKKMFTSKSKKTYATIMDDFNVKLYELQEVVDRENADLKALKEQKKELEEKIAVGEQEICDCDKTAVTLREMFPALGGK